MRIVNIMLAKGLGGMEQSFLDYTHVLQRAGHEVHSVVHPRAEILPRIDSPSTHVHTLASMGDWDMFASWQLARLLKTHTPQAVMAHGSRALALAARARAPRLIAVMNDYTIRVRRAHAVFAATADLMRHATEQGVAKEVVHLVPAMVNVPETMPKHTWKTKPVIGAMGRLVPQKGFEVLVASLAILRARGTEFRAIIAGDGEDITALKSQAAREGIAYEVEFTGWLNDKREFFDVVDIFCLPSHHEPVGLVLLEAMAQALPVVSTACEAATQMIESGYDGMLVPIGDATAMADGIEHMILNPRKAQQMGSNAYETVRDSCDVAVVAAQLDVALRKVCA